MFTNLSFSFFLPFSLFTISLFLFFLPRFSLLLYHPVCIGVCVQGGHVVKSLVTMLVDILGRREFRGVSDGGPFSVEARTAVDAAAAGGDCLGHKAQESGDGHVASQVPLLAEMVSAGEAGTAAIAVMITEVETRLRTVLARTAHCEADERRRFRQTGAVQPPLASLPRQPACAVLAAGGAIEQALNPEQPCWYDFEQLCFHPLPQEDIQM